MSTDRYRRGRALLARLTAQGGNPELATSASAPDLQRYAVEFVYGDIYSRTDLDLRQRQLVVIGALVTLGDVDGPLAGHLHIALNVGLTPEEISGAVLQTLPYAGFPRVIAAMAVVDQVLADNTSQQASTNA
ncbi:MULTISPECIES: carboxymuconolactone decarboxylase family protein [unclassified Nocardia]|uniref:carboxymuconolactone decarboxylase family protein n=1 Tax=unclassified Nocardia TaxID=2637762 RepID=UPI001CE4A238|nr:MULTISPECIES: carboxymuconolactone decarboxylase family protein [unclassified Nocardia]